MQVIVYLKIYITSTVSLLTAKGVYMANNTDFETFLKDINPSKSTIDEASRLHHSLREYLRTCDSYRSVYVDAYLSGSYAKQTFIRPKKDSDGCDIDVVIETNRSTGISPYDVLHELEQAIRTRGCYRNVRIQNHSVGIDMASFHLDVVPLVNDEDGALCIGSSQDGGWRCTDPKRHISWSSEVNQGFDNNYKPLVKIMKWWRRENCPLGVRFPKGITLEKMIADNLPEPDLTIEECVMQTMANLSTAYADEIDSLRVPFIEDPALSGNNLAAKYQHNDFVQFVNKLEEHLVLLAENGTGNDTWKTILGDNFPSEATQHYTTAPAGKSGCEMALKVSHRKELGYPKQAPKPNATVTATVTLPSGESINLVNDGPAIPKGSTVVYRVNCGPVKDSIVKWQVTNTGEEAMRICPRGGFEGPNEGKTSRREETAYTGKHYVQCFVIRKDYCVRWSKPFFINVE